MTLGYFYGPLLSANTRGVSVRRSFVWEHRRLSTRVCNIIILILIARPVKYICENSVLLLCCILVATANDSCAKGFSLKFKSRLVMFVYWLRFDSIFFTMLRLWFAAVMRYHSQSYDSLMF